MDSCYQGGDSMKKKQEKLIKKCITNDNPVILDIGACKGATTLFFLKSFPNSFVYSFEPDDRAISKFIRRRDKYKKIYKRNILSEYALSDVDGEEDFYSVDATGAGSLREPLLLLEPPFNNVIKNIKKVKTKKLDSWYEENNIGKIDFIWSDLQGSEDKMIRGGIKCLKNTRFLVIESIKVEAYKGIWNLNEIMSLLPNFKIIADFKSECRSDIFLENTIY